MIYIKNFLIKDKKFIKILFIIKIHKTQYQYTYNVLRILSLLHLEC